MPGLLNNISQRLHRPAASRPLEAEPDPARLEQLVALARDLLHAMEQFVISTPDLDTDRFLRRLRGTAGGLTTKADAPTLQLFRQWADSAITTFAALQRRYLTEREDELWRILDAYRRYTEDREERDTTHRMELMAGVHRLRTLTSITDIRDLKERLSTEIAHSKRLMEDKAREDKDRATALAAEVARLENALAAARGHANYDALTGLYHRGAFMDRLNALLAQNKPCALALLDLDDLTTINENLGHAAGDRLLYQVAVQMNRLSRASDVTARYAGDLFCLASPGVDAQQLSQRLIPATTRRHIQIEVEGKRCSALLSISMGVAAWDRSESAESLFRRAEQAMQAVKRTGKGQVRIAP